MVPRQSNLRSSSYCYVVEFKQQTDRQAPLHFEHMNDN